jgi:hypothetical protein
MVLPELKPHLGIESSFCYSFADMKREREAKIDELSVLCCIYHQKASPRKQSSAMQPSFAQYADGFFMNELVPLLTTWKLPQTVFCSSSSGVFGIS